MLGELCSGHLRSGHKTDLGTIKIAQGRVRLERATDLGFIRKRSKRWRMGLGTGLFFCFVMKSNDASKFMRQFSSLDILGISCESLGHSWRVPGDFRDINTFCRLHWRIVNFQLSLGK